jgi:hypothetical protein
VQVCWVAWRRGGVLARLLREPLHLRLWRDEVWPLQWRFALSWIGGYVIFQSVIPLSFSKLGPVDAGRIGMTLGIGWSLIGLASTWINASSPEFGRWAAAGDLAAMRSRLRWALGRGLAVSLGLSLVGCAIIALMQSAGLPLAFRVLPWPLFLLAMATAVSHIIQSSLAVVLRSFRREPILPVVLSEAAILAVVLPWLAGAGGLPALMIAYAGIHGGLALIAVTVIFLNAMRGKVGRV